jgi:hypothetical protein
MKCVGVDVVLESPGIHAKGCLVITRTLDKKVVDIMIRPPTSGGVTSTAMRADNNACSCIAVEVSCDFARRC